VYSTGIITNQLSCSSARETPINGSIKYNDNSWASPNSPAAGTNKHQTNTHTKFLFTAILQTYLGDSSKVSKYNVVGCWTFYKLNALLSIKKGTT